MRFLLFIFYTLVSFNSLHADAIVINKAMQSPSIAQYYIDDKGVRLDLELSMDNVKKFADLYPNDFRKILGLKELPIDKRSKDFLTKKLAIIADGKTLEGYVTSMHSGKKIQRDPITGDPLPVQKDNAPYVLYISIDYLFETPEPTTVDVISNIPAGIGFILYHKDQAVNDFRFLAFKQTLKLDWKDPFYTAFTAKPLQRQYRHPMSLFLYIEPYEVRKEFVLRPKDLQEWTELGLEGKEVLTVADQEVIKTKVAAFLMERAKVTIDGKETVPQLDRIHFIERTLKRSGVITPPRELPTSTATLGVIYSYPVASLPNKVDVNWDLFNEKINYIPAITTDEAGPFYHFLEPDVPVLTWNNYIRFPKDTSINSVSVTQQKVNLAWLSFSLLLLVIIFFILYKRKSQKIWMVLALVSVLFFLPSLVYIKKEITLPLQAQLDEKEATTLLNSLLENVYRSFVFKEENTIYDSLKKSVDDELLSDIYLQVRQSLKLKNQGGAEASVDTVTIQDLKLSSEDEGYALDASWDVNGSVGHWGHIHKRANRYSAEFKILPVNGLWKIQKMNVYNEERMK